MCRPSLDPRSVYSRNFVRDCRGLSGDLNADYLALAQRVQRYRMGIPILCSRLLREQLILLDVPHPALSANLANKWRDISDGNGSQPTLAAAQAAAQAADLWLAIGYEGVGVVLRLGDPQQRGRAMRLLLARYRSGQQRPLSRNAVQRVLEPAGLFVNMHRRRRGGSFRYKVGAELRNAMALESVSSRVLRRCSRDVSDFILTRCNSVRGTP